MDFAMNEEITNALKEVQRSRKLSGSVLVTLNRLCGERFWKALQAVANDLVKKYVFEPSGRGAWIVVGRSREYPVLSEIYCNCEDFYINVIVKRRADVCYHILAKSLAEALGVFSEVRVDDMSYDTLRAEWESLPEQREPSKRARADDEVGKS
jgi:predicted nucleic acid-binding Zn finger protein